MMTTHLREFAASTESSGAPARVEANLLAAFKQRAQVRHPKSESAPPSPAVSAPLSGRRYWAAAIAAGLLFIFGFATIVWRASGPANFDRSEQGAVAGREFGITLGLPDDFSPSEIQKDAGPTTSPRRHGSRHTPSSTIPLSDIAANTEIATDFLPMSYGSTANLQDGGQMVRVELPRSAMASFGFPVNMDRANEKVKADVLLGVDGLAHAIRFVR